jgi:hypothetical protein
MKFLEWAFWDLVLMYERKQMMKQRIAKIAQRNERESWSCHLVLRDYTSPLPVRARNAGCDCVLAGAGDESPRFRT